MLEIYARKSFTCIKGFTMRIEITVIIGSERGMLIKLTLHQSACKWHADNERNPFFLCKRKQFISDMLAKQVEDDLNRGEALLFQAYESLFIGFNADTPVLYQPFTL